MPALEVITPTGEITFYDLATPQGLLTLGRDPASDVILAAPGIEPVHALLDYRDSPYRLFRLNPALPAGPPLEMRPGQAVELDGYVLMVIDFSAGMASSRPGPADSPDFAPLGKKERAAPLGGKKEGAAPRGGKKERPPRPPRKRWGGGSFDLPDLLILGGLALALLVVAGLVLFSLRPAGQEASFGEAGLPARPEDDGEALRAEMLARLRQAKAVYARKDLPGEAGGTPVEMTYEAMFQEIAALYGLDWRMLAAIAYRESGLDPLAIGRDGDMGLMQILPITWNEWAPKVGVSDPYDPYSNVLVAAAYLAYLREYCRTRGYPQPEWALAAYNWGPENVRQVFERQGAWEASVPEPTRRYAISVLQMAGGR